MIGVVAEFNPFHSGHAYMINESKKILGMNEPIVCVMSGDFVQRGEAAIQDKYTRAINAVKGGADLILELPLPWCVSSSEHFARAAIYLLKSINCNFLSFGSECGDVEALRNASASTVEKLDDIKKIMKENPKLSFPKAKQLIVNDSLLNYPNNSLAVEYLKFSNNFEKIITIKRTNSHDGIGSAKDLRKNMTVPQLEIPIISRLTMLDLDYINTISGSENGLGNKLFNAIHESNNLNEIILKTKTKHFTESRVRRLIVSCCLGIRKEIVFNNPKYTRVLAYNEKGKCLLRDIKKSSDFPLITLPKEIYNFDDEIINVFVGGAYAHEFYNIGINDDNSLFKVNEFRIKPIFVQNDQ